MRMQYTLEGMRTMDEYVCVEHDGFALRKAQSWWNACSIANFPETADEAVMLFDRGACRVPRRILTKRNGKFWEIEDMEFDGDKPTPDTWLEERSDAFRLVEDDLPF